MTAPTTQLLNLDLTNTRRGFLGLDAMASIIAGFAPDFGSTVQATRTFGYRGARYLDDSGAWQKVSDGTIVCTDNATRYVQWDPAAGVSLESAVNPLRWLIARVICAGGLITKIEDLRDTNLHTPHRVRYRGDWAAGTFMRHDAVSHLDGLWSANTTTTEEPGAGTEWDLMVQGQSGPGGVVPWKRLITTIDATGMSEDDVEEGFVELGATCILYRADAPVLGFWLRLYGSAADRTADTRTDPDDVPTTPVILDLVFDVGSANSATLVSDEILTFGDGLLAINRDDPALGGVYYRLTRLFGGSGTFDLIYEDVYTTSGSNDDISTLTPTNPLSSGITGYETNAPSGDIVRSGSFNYVGWADVTASGLLVRLDAAVTHMGREFYQDIKRLGVDVLGSSWQIVVFAKDTAMGSWNEREYMYAKIVRSGVGGAVVPTLGWVDSTGADTTLDTATSISWALDTDRRMIVAVEGDGVTVNFYVADAATGANRVLLCTATVPGALQVAGQDRVGFTQVSTLLSGGFACRNFRILEGDVDPADIGVDITYLPLEGAA